MDFASPEVRAQATAMSQWLRGGDAEAIEGLRRFGATGTKHEATFKRAMGLGTSGAGDKLAPPGLIDSFYTVRDQHSPVRRHSTVITTDDGAPLKFPRTNDAESAVLVSENAAEASADVAVTEMVLKHYRFAGKIIRASEELVENAGAPLQQFFGRVFGKRIGRTVNSYFTTGTGSGQPMGIVTASTEGVETASPLAITFGELIELMFSVDAAYLPESKWMMSEETLADVRMIEDSADRPIFLDNLLLGKPVVINNAMASIGAGSKPILYGDFSLYVVREVEGVSLRNYRERYADYHEIGFAASIRTDGNLLDSEAVKHLKMAD